ncbi:MAG: AMP-binding protein [Acidobacteria bacterium]|nr:AMP-binding protein [Acidobacteriota bacterium]
MPEPLCENLKQLLEARVAQCADKALLFSEADGRVFTYRTFDEAVNRAAALLHATGVKKGDCVSLFLTNGAEYLIAYFACFKLGAWAGPVNAHLKTPELAFILANSAAAVVITQNDLYAQLAAAQANLPSLHHLVIIGAEWSIIRCPASGVRPTHQTAPSATSDPGHRTSDAGLSTDTGHRTPDVELAADDEAVIIYTSGTTGKPKGVLLTHGNLLTNAKEIAEWLRLTAADRSLMLMPLFHVNALMTTGIAALWAGASIVLAEKFSASRHWDIIAKYGVTYFGSVATMLSRLNHTYPQGLPDGFDTRCLRFALCGSAPVPVEVMKTYEALFKSPVIEGYGLSESTCRATFNPLDERRKLGSIGLPIGNEVKIFDDDDNELAPYQVGEIVLRGANLMKGYYQNEEATAQAFRSGWFHSNDLGYRDEEGFFYLVDRKSDLIIRGGENIYPREIDETLYQHPKVKDAATIGVADAWYGEEVRSYIVLKDGETASAEELMEFCRRKLADFKCPKSVIFLADIPKGPTGKLLKKILREG